MSPSPKSAERTQVEIRFLVVTDPPQPKICPPLRGSTAPSCRNSKPAARNSLGQKRLRVHKKALRRGRFFGGDWPQWHPEQLEFLILDKVLRWRHCLRKWGTGFQHDSYR